MKFWKRLAIWKKALLILLLLLVLFATVVVGFAVRFWLNLVGSGSQICIPQGTRTVLFTTLTTIKAIRPGPDGRLEETTIDLGERGAEASPILPIGCMPDEAMWVPLFDWTTESVRDEKTGRRRYPQWNHLLRLDLETLECVPIIRTRGYIFPQKTINCLDDHLAVMKPNFVQGTLFGPDLLAIFDMSEATCAAISASLKAHRGVILLGEHDYVGVGYDLLPDDPWKEYYSDKPGYLSHNGQKMTDNVYEVLGATPDLSRVFFVKHEPQACEATVSALWTYSPDGGAMRRLMDWTGEKLRVTSDSRSFGFLETREAGKRHRRIVMGVQVFDIDGNLIRHIRFAEPLRPTGLRWGAYDWSPDWGIIAYFNKPYIVIQSLEGSVLGRFRTLHYVDIKDCLRRARQTDHTG